MSGKGRSPTIVTRDYKPGPDYCVQALELLLMKANSKKAVRPAPEPGSRDGTKLQGDSADARIISR